MREGFTLRIDQQAACATAAERPFEQEIQTVQIVELIADDPAADLGAEKRGCRLRADRSSPQ